MTKNIINSQESPTVSVIMNCLNGEKYLREAIDSIYAQTYEDWEIIFWEDLSSSDNSGKIAQSYGSKLRYFKADVSLPLYGSRNLAIRQARGKYIAFLDQDDLWLPTKLEEQISLFEENPDVGIVFSDDILFNESGGKKCLFKFKKPYRGNVFQELLLDNFIHTPTVVIRRKVLDSLTYWFDNRCNMLGDYDAWLRISYKWKVDYVDKPLAKYRVHKNSTTSTRGRSLSAFELEFLIENLCNTIYGFEDKYSQACRLLKRKRDVNLSLLDWEENNNKRARKRLKKYIRESGVHLVLFLLMFLPYKYFFYPIYKLYNKNIMNN